MIVALDRGMRVLEYIASSNGASLSDLARATGIPVASMHRILATLKASDMVEFSDTLQKWFIGTQAFRIGNAYLNRSNIVEAARPIMRELSEQTGETCNLAVENSGDVVFLCQVESDNPIRVFFRTGTRGFMHASGIGKTLMAHLSPAQVDGIVRTKGLPSFTPKTIVDIHAFRKELDLIRERGWALDNEERFVGMRCVAAPVFNSFGEAVAGVSVSGLALRLPDDAIDRIGELVKEAAQRVTDTFTGRISE
ncbi:IclR family transcriptional regulator [Tropicimonas sp. TH_r6]|nr:IclR family transcriptional regulator [Tropicimonas sp. TH_r6]MDV7142013.1 IclR family transcriptional regulator [Tropicimonas sp. TH_r6]